MLLTLVLMAEHLEGDDTRFYPCLRKSNGFPGN